MIGDLKYMVDKFFWRSVASFVKQGGQNQPVLPMSGVPAARVREVIISLWATTGFCKWGVALTRQQAPTRW